LDFSVQPMTTRQSLARLGSVCAFVGAIVLFASTLLHPLSRDPNNSPEAFAEYAADSLCLESSRSMAPRCARRLRLASFAIEISDFFRELNLQDCPHRDDIFLADTYEMSAPFASCRFLMSRAAILRCFGLQYVA
jgi:hypothetical protein